MSSTTPIATAYAVADAEKDELEEAKKKQLVQSVIWLIVLVAVALPLSWFLAPIWIFLLPVEAFIPAVKQLNRDIIEKIMLWPRVLGDSVRNGSENIPLPFAVNALYDENGGQGGMNDHNHNHHPDGKLSMAKTGLSAIV